MMEADWQDLVLEESLVKSFKALSNQNNKIVSLSELPLHAEPDNKNPPKIDLKSEIDLDLHAITGNSYDINLPKFAWKKSSNQNKWTICGGFLLFRITVLDTNALTSAQLRPMAETYFPAEQTMRSKQAKKFWF